MSIRFHCDTCRRPIRVPDGSEGKKARCPECFSIVRIPFEDGAISSSDFDLAIPNEEDPLGIKDPENIRLEAEPTPQAESNPFAATIEASKIDYEPDVADTSFPGTSSKKFKQYRFELRLCTTVVMICCLIALVLMTIGVGVELMEFFEGKRHEGILYRTVGLLPVILLHIGTLLCLSEARLMRNLRIAWLGLILSLIPFANYSVCLLFPAAFTFWAMHTLNRDEITFAFQSVTEKSSPE
ncbi:hypothetical protein ACYFX5_13650 [Bremerella sp. T1]|uniref:hypothetical protein n=1 Tax=Bremerella sp. TYQ1 TaxID=3119568 RepID=UPI001CCF47EC|nr:hypothetical protein [Bremerella volcania]UBM34104.1 hypothetical protein LA756_15590 [Bremerella volcania]